MTLKELGRAVRALFGLGRSAPRYATSKDSEQGLTISWITHRIALTSSSRDLGI